MNAHDWGLLTAAFLTSAVEWVEAYTIVLAVAVTVGWRRAGTAALAALITVAALIAVTGGALSLGLDMHWLRLAIGVLLLLFGLRWLAKAVARAAGLIALHDEAAEFAETREELSRADHQAAWLIAFKGVLLEGLEVWLIVVALGARPGAFGPVGTGALIGLVAVLLLGFALRKPLTRVPENGIKFVVGSALLSFGTFWTIEGIAGPSAWAWSDWTLLVLFALYAGSGLLASQWYRRRAAALRMGGAA
ncbi:High-affinity Fe2+/Pb2+ permease [Acidihalobacter ferrooxydans]|uniref:High-affinity Fe2+/Pb2+ permease n=2 Tax=Acidihalobacter ferrooxydans TaxID=1765967 RepID=A0A1P8ULK6_9GAMM|nr:High-affinity Fe2+/Pb2+ permease [Acidihalobacter ferrooxydans]